MPATQNLFTKLWLNNMSKISGWELYRAIGQKHGNTRFTDELYQWWANKNRTLGYVTSAIATLRAMPEQEAIEVMKHAYFRLEKKTEMSWPTWLEKNKIL